MRRLLFTLVLCLGFTTPTGLRAQERRTVTVISTDPADGERLSRTLLQADDLVRAVPPTAQLGGSWILGAKEVKACPRATLAPSYVTDALTRAGRRIDNLETAEAQKDLEGVRLTMSCLAGPVDPRDFYRLHFLEGVAAWFSAGLPSARPALTRALAVLPAEPFDESYAPELGALYREVQKTTLAATPVPVAAAAAREGQPFETLIDGQRVGATPLLIVPGEHILQLRDGDGHMFGAVLDVESFAPVLVAPPGQAGTVATTLDGPSRQALADSVGRSSGLRLSEVWFVEGRVPWSLRDGAAAKRRGARDLQGRGAGIAGIGTPRLIVAVGGGWQFTARNHYGVVTGDVSGLLIDRLRLWVHARHSFGPRDPTSGRFVTLTPFGAGLQVRFRAPFVHTFGVAFTGAVNGFGSGGALPFLPGVLAQAELEIPLGQPRLVLRPQIELGTLERFFLARAGAVLSVAIGGS